MFDACWALAGLDVLTVLLAFAAHLSTGFCGLGAASGMAPKRKPTIYPKGHVDGLAKLLADRQFTHELLLQSGTLLRWHSPKAVGVVSATSLRFNKAVMHAVAEILGPQASCSLGLIVGPLKEQARTTNKNMLVRVSLVLMLLTAPLQVKQIRSDLSMEPDPGNVFCEAHAIKQFQTLINKRLFASKRKREPCLE